MRNSKLRINNFEFLISLALSVLVWSCASEQIRKQEEEIQRQQEEIARQRQEIEELKLAQRTAEQKRENCNRAFREFEKAQAAQDRDQAVELYRQGLKLCPGDDVAHYELGQILSATGRAEEAAEEFEAALRINPGFQDAKRRLEAIKKR